MTPEKARRYIDMIKYVLSQAEQDNGGCFDPEWMELLADMLPMLEAQG